jgi:hypothetical protein
MRPFPGPGAKMRVSSEGGYWPRWRRDGKELFYVSNDRILMSVPIDSTAAFKPGIPQALFRTPIQKSLGLGLVDPLEVSPDGQRFLFIPGNEQEISEPLRIVVNWQALLKPQ